MGSTDAHGAAAAAPLAAGLPRDRTLRALGGPSWSVETERRINDHYAAYQESVRAHNEAWRRSDIKFVAGMPMLGQKKHPSGG